jgi:Tol biopolymer transport system component/uncharacterized protein YegL
VGKRRWRVKIFKFIFYFFFLFSLYLFSSTDLIFLIDGSASISDEDFSIMLNGIASAVEDPSVIPHNNTVSITVIQFSGAGRQRVEVGPVLIDSTNYSVIANQIRNIKQFKGMTAFAGAINLAVNTINNWPNKGEKQIINILTDGMPTDEPYEAGPLAAENAINNGIEKINAIGIGVWVYDEFLWDIVQPHYSGYPDPTKRPTQPGENYGYVWHAYTFEELPPIIRTKIMFELGSTISLHNNYSGIQYSPSGIIVASGGNPPYKFEILNGIPGLYLFQSSSNAVEVRGVPEKGGTYNFTVKITDSSDPPATTITSSQVNIFDPPYVPVVRTGGKIIYVKDIERDNNGNIIKTGNLFIKDIETFEEHLITNYSGNFIIRDPSFSYDGNEIIYTSNVSGKWQIYIVNPKGTYKSVESGIVCDTGYEHEYASISPDKKYIAFVETRDGRKRLWVYNRSTKIYSLILDDYYLKISHLSFIENDKIVFTGEKNYIQDIYTIKVDGSELTNLTKNTSPSPKYGRIMTSYRYANTISFYDDISGRTYFMKEIIYPKKTYISYGNWTKWDIYSYNIDTGVEVNLTKTPDIDEYDPCFGNVADLWRGDMFYSTNLLGIGDDIWRANYEWFDWYTRGNGVKEQWTGNITNSEKAGQVDFIPDTYLGKVEEEIKLEGTRFVYISNNQIYRANSDGSQATVLTDGNATKSEANLAVNGGKIVFVDNGNSGKTQIIKMNHDGTGIQVFAKDTDYNIKNIKEASISPDGRWVVYVKEEGVNQYDIYAKNIEGWARSRNNNRKLCRYRISLFQS